MRSRALVVCLGLALLLTSLPLLAQLPTGTITGKVASSEGEALPGVTVTVTSPALQGTRSTTTSETGEYNIPFLPPGEYEVSFELEGFANPKQSVKISAAQTTQIDAELANTSVSEEIVVTGTYETISTAPEAATTYEKELIESLPIERDIRQTVLLTPGVAATGPVGAAGTGARNRGISIAGSQSYENLFLVNGVVITENLRGQPYELFIEDAIEETTTTVSGVSAEYGRFSGGVVNTITKSGGNEMHGSFRSALTNQSWEEKTPVTTTELKDEINERYEATLGGWIWKDRIWYFLAGRDFGELNTFQTAQTNIPFDAGIDQQRYEGKLTLSPYQGHRLVGSYIKIDEEEVGNRFGSIMDTRSLVTRTLPQELMAFNYTGVITENFFVEGQYSERKFTFENSGSQFRDRIFGTLMVDSPLASGRRWWSPTFCGVCTPEERNNENILAKGSWFLSSESVGSHDLSFGYDTFEDVRVANNHQSGSDFRIITSGVVSGGDVVYPRLFTDTRGDLSQFIQWNPILKFTEGTSFVTNSYFINDKWRLNDHWSFNVGVRYDENDGDNAEGQKVADDSRISPRVSAAWDLQGDGNWIFNANYGEYVTAIANNQANSTTSAGNSATYRWNYRGPAINTDPSQPLIGTEEALRIIFQWFDEQGGTNNTTTNFRSVTIPGGTSGILESLDSPFGREYSAGVSKRLGSRGVARVDYVHRDYEDFYSSRIDLSTGSVTLPGSNTRADFAVLENSSDGIERVYDGVHAQAQYRFGDRLNLGGVYTWSHLRGTFDGETSANGPVASAVHEYAEYKDPEWNSPRGDLALDQRHRARAWAVYDVLKTDRHHLTASLLQNFATGLPFGALGAVNSSTFVQNPGYVRPPTSVTYWFTARDAFRTDDILSTDVSFNYAFQWKAFGKAMEVYLQPEILNVFNDDSALLVNTTIFDATTGCNGQTIANCRVDPSRPFNNNSSSPDYNPSRTLQRFNPFTETPVEGVHWVKHDAFGEAVVTGGAVANDYQVPRTFRFSIGFRF